MGNAAVGGQSMNVNNILIETKEMIRKIKLPEADLF